MITLMELGIAVDREEYIEGGVAFAAPLETRLKKLHAAIWAVASNANARRNQALNWKSSDLIFENQVEP